MDWTLCDVLTRNHVSLLRFTRESCTGVPSLALSGGARNHGFWGDPAVLVFSPVSAYRAYSVCDICFSILSVCASLTVAGNVE